MKHCKIVMFILPQDVATPSVLPGLTAEQAARVPPPLIAAVELPEADANRVHQLAAEVAHACADQFCRGRL